MSSKRAVAAIAKQPAAAGSIRGLARPVGAVDQQDVLAAVVVDVEEGGAGTQRLGQVLLPERAVVVRETTGPRRFVMSTRRTHGRLAPRRAASSQGANDGRPAAATRARVIPAGRVPSSTAKSTSSAVLCTPRALIRLARCTATVLTLRSSITRDLLVRLAVGDQLQHLFLTLREPIVRVGRSCRTIRSESHGSGRCDSSGARYCSPAATARTARVRSFSIAFFRM